MTLKRYIGKFWRKTDLWFEKRLEKFVKFSPEHLKVSKLGLWWDDLKICRGVMYHDNEE